MKRFLALAVAVLLLGCDAATRTPTFTFSYPGGGINPNEDDLVVEVTAASFSPDGKYLLLGHRIVKGRRAWLPATLQLFVLWDIAKGEPIKSWGGQNGSVYFLRFLPDGKRAIVLEETRGLSLIDAFTGREVWVTKPYSNGTGFPVGLSPDGTLALTTGADGDSDAQILKVWDVSKGKLLRELGKASVSSITVSPDNKRGFTGCGGTIDEPPGAVRVWRLSDGEVLRAWKGAEGWSAVGSIFPDNKSALLMKNGERGSSALRLMVVNIVTGETMRMFDAQFALALCLTPDAKRVVAQTGSSTFTTWETETGKAIRVQLRFLQGKQQSYTGKTRFSAIR
ncbi:MAG: hypothetical protein K2R98_19015, partial [Gemmataceae bacterium]|nr:hypothetical protein [Gemmataceae bacterium]